MVAANLSDEFFDDATAQKKWEAAASTYIKAKPQNLGWNYITRPFLIRYLKEIQFHRVLDAGCGFGDTLDILCPQPIDSLGVDWSLSMIEEAKHRYPKKNFIHKNIYDLNEHEEGLFDLVIAVNVLQDCEDLYRSAQALYNVTEIKGRAIFVIENPYWTAYKFQQTSETPRLPVRQTKVFTSNFLGDELEILGWHRPLNTYRDAFKNVGFRSICSGHEIEPDFGMEIFTQRRLRNIGALDTDMFVYFDLYKA